MTGDYPELMRRVAPLLGYDPRAADRKGVARFRSHGSLKIDFSRGTFADFEAGVAGGALDFIRLQMNPTKLADSSPARPARHDRGRARGRISAARVSRASTAHARTAVTPLAVFELRAWARAYLWQAGAFDLATAVDELQAAAERDGLIAELGQNRVQELMADAFHSVARRRR